MAREKYKKKPEVWYAVQYDGTNHAEVIEFCPDCVYDEETEKLTFAAGMIVVDPTAWVMEDAARVFRVMSNNDFIVFFELDHGPPV